MSSRILEPGFRLGKYEVESHIATGGMGAVYRARDVELRRAVALKVLPTHLAERPSVLERFRREARHAARLSHPNIVTLYECGYDPAHNLYYLAMEFIEGINLLMHIDRKGRLEPEETRRILIHATRALEHAFAQGIIHRDVKPSNFMLARDGNKLVVKLTDLGLARAEDDDEFKVTREGSTVGTVDYMSPEQARDSQSTDIRSDIYSLGCTAYHMLSGRAPFSDGGIGERVFRHMQEAPKDVREFNPAVSEEFWAVLWKMLAKNPQDRYASPTDLLRDLKRINVTAAEEAAAAAAAAPPRRRRTEPDPSDHDRTPTPASTPDVPRADTTTLVTPEQARAAAAFHERAVQVLAEGGGDDYARQLIGSCMKLDPFNPAYRRTLREINRQASGSTLGRWFGTLNVLAIKAKMRAARTTGDWRKVLEHGEEALARQPADPDTHIEMAEAASALELPQLARWLLEQGREQSPDDITLMKALAALYEKDREWKGALLLWQHIREEDPDDPDARKKIDDLTVNHHLSRRQYKR
jgi:serine/threonine protein kinase